MRSSAYTDLSGTQTVTFNDIRKYSAVLMAFPIKAAVQPYLGVGWGIMHTGDPADHRAPSRATRNELGSSGFGTFLGGFSSRSVASWRSASTRSRPARARAS